VGEAPVAGGRRGFREGSRERGRPSERVLDGRSARVGSLEAASSGGAGQARSKGWGLECPIPGRRESFVDGQLRLEAGRVGAMVRRRQIASPGLHPLGDHKPLGLRRCTGLDEDLVRVLTGAQSRGRENEGVSPGVVTGGQCRAQANREPFLLTASLGNHAALASLEEACQRLGAARERLDGRPQRSLGGRTAIQADEDLPWWYDRVDRETFHAAACAAIDKAVLGCRSTRERRAAEREAIYQTLERYGLIRPTRGRAPLHATIGEGVS